MFQTKVVQEKKNTHFTFNTFFPKIAAKNMAKTDGPQMTSQYGTNAWYAG